MWLLSKEQNKQHFLNVNYIFSGIYKLSFIYKVSNDFLNLSYFLLFLLYFRFWGTCADHVAMWFAASIPLSPICGISPHVIPPQPSYPLLSLPIPPYRSQCVVLPSLCPCVLIVHHPPMSENMWYFIFCSCVSLLRMMFSRVIHVPTENMNSPFLMAA